MRCNINTRVHNFDRSAVDKSPVISATRCLLLSEMSLSCTTKGSAVLLVLLICVGVAMAFAVRAFGQEEEARHIPDDILDYLQGLKLGKVIIDTDAGADDAVAILLALNYANWHSELDILGITTVAGNTNRDQVVVNVLKTLRVVHSKLRVYPGSNGSLLVTPPTDDFYGKDGFGDVPYPNPPTVNEAKKENAVLAMVRLVRENPGEVSVVALGPLTNVAMATRLDPYFRSNLKSLVWLGGSVEGVGNVKPGIEFNANFDAASNYIVFNSSGCPVIMVPWETVYVERSTNAEWRKNVLGKLNSPEIRFLNLVEQVSLKTGHWEAADAKAMAIALEPDMVTQARFCHVEAVTEGQLTRGMFVVDYRQTTGLPKNAIIVEDFDAESFEEMLLKYLS